MKHILKGTAYLLTYKRIDENRIDPITFELKDDDVSYFNLSSNSILSFCYNGMRYYFRECPCITDLKTYFEGRIIRFFEMVSSQRVNTDNFKQDLPIKIIFSSTVISRFQEYINNQQKERLFIRRLANIDLIAEKYKFSIWEKNSFNCAFFENFGLHNLPYTLHDIAIYFLWYMRGVAGDYRIRKIVRGEEHSFFNAVKAIASKIIAEELGLTNLIVDAQLCILHIKDKKLLGVASPAARGNRMSDSSIGPTGLLQRETLNLNALDWIIHQPDHGPNNYNVYTDESGGFHLCAFDNDNPRTLFPFFSTASALSGCSPLLNRMQMINRPYFDEIAAHNIFNVDMVRLRYRLKPYLNILQINGVLWRIAKIKRAITKTQQIRHTFLLCDKEWNIKTIKEEISGRYGTTYLMNAIEIR